MTVKENIARGYLWLAAVVFVGLGVALLFWPTEILKSVEVKFETPTAFADIRADYGGCILGVGLFLVWCASHRQFIRAGLLCVGLIFFGLRDRPITFAGDRRHAQTDHFYSDRGRSRWGFGGTCALPLCTEKKLSKLVLCQF